MSTPGISPTTDLLRGKRILVTGVLTPKSIAFAIAAACQQAGADVVLTSFGRAMSLTQRSAQRLDPAPEVLELDVDRRRAGEGRRGARAGHARRPGRRGPRDRLRSRGLPRRRLPRRPLELGGDRVPRQQLLAADARRRLRAVDAGDRRLDRRAHLRRAHRLAALRLDGPRQGSARSRSRATWRASSARGRSVSTPSPPARSRPSPRARSPDSRC